MRKFGSFLVFTALVVLAASTGMHFLPGDWYAALNKPVVRARYEFAEIEEPGLGAIIDAFIARHSGPGAA